MRTETWQAVKALLATDPPDARQWGRLAAMAPNASVSAAARLAEVKMITQPQVAALLGVQVRTLLNWRRRGLIAPAATPTRNTVLYRLSDVEALANGGRLAAG
jgi:hypothetical protein